MSNSQAHPSEGKHAARTNDDDRVAAENVDTDLKQIIADVLGLDAETVLQFAPETGLFGHLPELDSMAVAGLLTEMEDRLGIFIEDDDVDGEMLETYGGLLAFAQSKLPESEQRHTENGKDSPAK